MKDHISTRTELSWLPNGRNVWAAIQTNELFTNPQHALEEQSRTTLMCLLQGSLNSLNQFIKNMMFFGLGMAMLASLTFIVFREMS